MTELAPDTQAITATYDCREPHCDQEAKSRVGRYAYCDYHQQVRAEQRLDSADTNVITATVRVAPITSSSPLVRLGEVARRIAAFTSISRTRSETDVRFAVNGGAIGTLNQRAEAAVARLETVAERLEKALS